MGSFQSIFIRGIAIYGILITLLILFIKTSFLVDILLPVFALLAYLDYKRVCKKRIQTNNDYSNKTLITMGIVIYLLGIFFRFIHVLLVRLTLEQVLIFYLTIISIYHFRSFFSKFYIAFDKIKRDVSLGIVYYLLMLSSTFGPLYVIYLLYGNAIILDFSTLLRITPSLFVVAIGEEYLFRGYLQNTLSVKIGIYKGIFTSSFVLFSLWHIVYIPSYGLTVNFVLYILGTGILGFFIGMAYKNSKTLLPVIITHAVWDIVQGSIEFKTYNPITLLALLTAILSAILIYSVSIIKLETLTQQVDKFLILGKSKGSSL